MVVEVLNIRHELNLSSWRPATLSISLFWVLDGISVLSDNEFRRHALLQMLRELQLGTQMGVCASLTLQVVAS